MSQTHSPTDMALSYKARRRWSLFILLVGMPAYVVLAVTVLSTADRLPMLLELPVYVVLGIAWVLPFRFVFRGIGKPDPAASEEPSAAVTPPDPERDNDSKA